MTGMFLVLGLGMAGVRAAESTGTNATGGNMAPTAGPTVVAAPASPAPAKQAPFILGADISWIPDDEAAGAEYYDHGVKLDIFDILKKYKFNYVRLGVIVPTDTMNLQAGLTLDQVKAMAKRAKAAGLGVLIDFMYSDTWASPEGQPKPATWASLSFPAMVQALHDHTKETLLALQAQGTTPDMVQIGNEISYGLLWPEGRVTSKISTGNPTTDAHNANVTNAGGWAQMAALLKAGIAATHEVDPNIKIMLHHSLGRNDALVHEWITKLTEQGVNFDIVGLSCYTEHAPRDWQTTIADITQNFPNLQVVAVEYSGKKRYVNDLVFLAPQNKGLGTFIWEPTRSQETIFDRPAPPPPLPSVAVTGNATAAAGNATPTPARPRTSPGGRYDTNALIELYPVMAKDYGVP